LADLVPIDIDGKIGDFSSMGEGDIAAKQSEVSLEVGSRFGFASLR
jgi:hypothetical protein